MPPHQLPAAQEVEWKLDSDMMNQKWGTVLRTLQPSALNGGGLSPRNGLTGKSGLGGSLGGGLRFGTSEATSGATMPRPAEIAPGSPRHF